jgi:hypothetical protein
MMPTIGKVCGITVGSTPQWIDIASTDFVDLTPYKDPNDTSYDLVGGTTNDAAVGAGGAVTLTLASDTTAWDGPAEGACWRLKIAQSAYGWRGDGTQAIIVRLTPTSNPAVVTKPMVCVGLCDQGGDPTAANARCPGVGFGWADATNIASAYANTSTGAAFGLVGAPYAAHAPDVLVTIIPSGPVGDESNAGAVDAATGSHSSILRSDPTDYTYYTTAGFAVVTTNTITDGVYLNLYAGFDAADAARTQTTIAFTLEYAIIDILPTGEWS